MKKRFYLIGLAVLFLVPGFITAHPAKKVDLVFDPVTHILQIRIDHEVKDAAKHFIEAVTVTLNGEELVIQKLSAQDDLTGLDLIYKLNTVKTGDAISVSTKCNIMGKKSGKLKIE